MDDAARVAALRSLATAHGVELEYWDVAGVHHPAGVDALLAVLVVMGVLPEARLDLVAAALDDQGDDPALVAPVVVGWAGERLDLEVAVDAAVAARIDVELVLEDGGRLVLGAFRSDDVEPSGRGVRLDLGVPDLPAGHHRLVVATAGRTGEAVLLVAPRQVRGLGADERLWGVFAPLYALRPPTPTGPSFSDLARLGRWIDRVGGRLVGTLPVLASWFEPFYDPSPYAPVSRLHWNELYLDLEALPGSGPALAGWLRAPATVESFAARRAGAFDYRQQHRLRSEALALAAAGAEPAAVLSVDGFDPGIADYAAFRAAVHRHGTSWHTWSDTARRGRLGTDDGDPLVAGYHEYVQHAARVQLRDVASDLARRDQRLYLDLPVGCHPDGYDAWRHQDLFAWGAAAGAPPDDFFTGGQNWGFPPMLPARLRATGHAYWRDVLRHHMSVAGMLRIDHIMGLHRMFWVVDGLPASQGVYVRYPLDELLAVLAVESQRHDCVVVGEDLGTVPDEIRDAMDRHRVLGMHVTEFAVPRWAGAAPTPPKADQLAGLDTHDTPPFAAWCQALDVDRREAMGLTGGDDADDERAGRRQQVANLTGFLAARGHLRVDGAPAEADLVAGALEYLGSSDSPVVLVDLGDVLGDTEPHNVPGTPSDRPNWVHRLAAELDDLERDDEVAAVLGALQAARLGSHARARQG